MAVVFKGNKEGMALDGKMAFKGVASSYRFVSPFHRQQPATLPTNQGRANCASESFLSGPRKYSEDSTHNTTQ
jgi:hypothetical protein